MMGKYKLNTYIYAPKDDPKHRASWRELYSTSELAKMKELVETATENNVKFIYAISPEYCDPMLTSYTTTFASSLNSKIMLMWTGKAVVPLSITQANLSSINSRLGRKVFIWWIYPVNDYAKNNLFMGPCTSLEKGLYNSISGLVSNPMNQGYASYIPLLTTADCLLSLVQHKKPINRFFFY